MRMVAGVGAIGLLMLAGCQSKDSADAAALQTAFELGQIEMSCPEATPTITSREVVQPVDANAPTVARVDYTVSVAGCGESRVYSVTCADSGGSCSPGK
jgi:hypothetical protein